MLNENDLGFLEYGVCCNYLISQNEMRGVSSINFYYNIEADMMEQEPCKKSPLGELIFFFSLHYS